MSTPGSNHANLDDVQVRWVMAHPDAQDLAEVLGMLEDFVRQASSEAITELATHRLARPIDPSRWADWLADYLGDQALALHTLTRSTTPGDPR